MNLTSRNQRVPATRLALSLALILLGRPTRAQKSPTLQYGDVTVEVMGLRHWSLRMLQDSLQRYAPGQTLADAACMATLRYKMGFADASVTRFSGFDRTDPKRAFVSVRVLEPRPRSNWRALPTGAFESLLPQYAPLILPVTDSTGAIWVGRLLFGFQIADSAQRDQLLQSTNPEARVDYQRLTDFLEANAGDAMKAMRVLDSSAAPGNRIVAALVLSKHPERDESWHALIRALRDPHEGVRAAAATSLRRLPRRPMNWRPVAGELRLLLGGANVSEIESVMRLLMETQLDPALASSLAGGNSGWLLPMLDSRTPVTAYVTREFLKTLNRGSDLGSGSRAWRAWLAKL